VFFFQNHLIFVLCIFVIEWLCLHLFYLITFNFFPSKKLTGILYTVVLYNLSCLLFEFPTQLA